MATSQRTREIGLRLAMGAEPRNVVWLVKRGAVGLGGAGVAVGLLGPEPEDHPVSVPRVASRGVRDLGPPGQFSRVPAMTIASFAASHHA